MSSTLDGEQEASEQIEKVQVSKIDRSKLKPLKSILKSEKTGEKLSLNKEKTNFNLNIEYADDNDGYTNESEVKSATLRKQQARRVSAKKYPTRIMDVSSCLDKLPALPREYTAWILNTDFKSPTMHDTNLDTTKLCQDWGKLEEDVTFWNFRYYLSKAESGFSNGFTTK